MSSKSTYTIEELRERAAQRRGGDKITVVAGGKPFTIPAPGFWTDEQKAAGMAAGRTGDVEFYRHLMGADQYAKFTEAGGRADDMNLLVEEYKLRQEVGDLGESSAS